jgi:hypothetical protein
LAGSAALLVGVGLDCNRLWDVISGVILHQKDPIKIGDVLEIDGNILKLRNWFGELQKD